MLLEAARLAAEGAGAASWRMVYQSRSGPPSQPWLEPDVCDALDEEKAALLQDWLKPVLRGGYEAAYRHARQVDAKEAVVVGVNRFTVEDEDEPEDEPDDKDDGERDVAKDDTAAPTAPPGGTVPPAPAATGLAVPPGPPVPPPVSDPTGTPWASSAAAA